MCLFLFLGFGRMLIVAHGIGLTGGRGGLLNLA